MTLLIKSVRILAGNRKFPDPMDVFISGDKISAIGNFPRKTANQVLDGQGAYLAPGFIDIDAETDHYLEIFNHPAQDDFLKQGITTVIGGHEGSSLAPLLYGTLESLEEWTNPNRGNVDWRTVREFLGLLDKRKLGVHFGTFVGHSTIRRALIGDHLRELTKNELAVFAKLLEEALQDGAFGLSANLKSVYSRKTPFAELKMLGKIVGKHNGFLSMALRKAAGIDPAIDEILKLSRETEASTILNNFMPVEGQSKDYEQALEKIEGAGEELGFYFSVSPFERSIRPLYRFLPDWAQTGSLDQMSKELHNDWLKPRILKDFVKIDPDSFFVAKAWNNPALIGASLRELMDIYEIKKPEEAIYRLMQGTELRALITYRNVDEKMMMRALSHSRSLVGSKGVSFGRSIMRERMARFPDAAQAFPKFIALTTTSNIMPLETAVKKITTLPAELFGLKDRGQIAEGKRADLVCFKAEGGSVDVMFTVVQGNIAVQNGEFQNVLAGKPIYHSEK